MKRTLVYLAICCALIVAAGPGCCVGDQNCRGGSGGIGGFDSGPGDCCGTDPCSRGPRRRPFANLLGMFACNGGCGDVYYDEWVSDPPDCCDPCDNCGNWTGPRPCRRSIWDCLSLRGLWGNQYSCDQYGADCECDSCSGGMKGGTVIYEGPVMQHATSRPLPAPQKSTPKVYYKTSTGQPLKVYQPGGGSRNRAY